MITVTSKYKHIIFRCTIEIDDKPLMAGKNNTVVDDDVIVNDNESIYQGHLTKP